MRCTTFRMPCARRTPIAHENRRTPARSARSSQAPQMPNTANNAICPIDRAARSAPAVKRERRPAAGCGRISSWRPVPARSDRTTAIHVTLCRLTHGPRLAPPIHPSARAAIRRLPTAIRPHCKSRSSHRIRRQAAGLRFRQQRVDSDPKCTARPACRACGPAFSRASATTHARRTEAVSCAAIRCQAEHCGRRARIAHGLHRFEIDADRSAGNHHRDRVRAVRDAGVTPARSHAATLGRRWRFRSSHRQIPQPPAASAARCGPLQTAHGVADDQCAPDAYVRWASAVLSALLAIYRPTANRSGLNTATVRRATHQLQSLSPPWRTGWMPTAWALKSAGPMRRATRWHGRSTASCRTREFRTDRQPDCRI